MESELDQPDNLMRLRLVLTILETCGVFFSTGLAKKRLDYYLVYLQVGKTRFLLKKFNDVIYLFVSIVLLLVQKIFTHLDG